mgnify:CR=1 FL=1
MKILVLANRDIASNLALNYLFQGNSENHQFEVLLSSSVGKANHNKPEALQQLAFFEQTLFNQILFPALKNQSINPIDTRLSFEGFQSLGIVVSDIHSINCQQGLKTVSDFAPDLIVSIRFGLILQSEVIEIPRFGVINLHSGELPTYRGVMATFRAMQQADPECGTTLHYINDSGIDNGEIISISKQAINYQRSYLFNTLAVYKQGVKDLIAAINTIEKTEKHSVKTSNQQVNQKQNSQVNYYSFPTECELKSFQKRGLKLYEYRDIIDVAKNFH